MPSKFDKISFVVSLAIGLTIAVGIIWMNAVSGMWRGDLAALGGIVMFTTMGCSFFMIGTRLRGKIHTTKENLSMCLQGGMVAIVVDCALVFLAAFTVGYQPWLMFVLVPIFLLGVTCLVLAALLRGSMQESR